MSNTLTFSDQDFWISNAGMRKLYRLAEQQKCSRTRAFRTLAFRLLGDFNPVFKPSGQDPRYNLRADIDQHKLEELIAIAADLGLPPVSVGELIVSYVPREDRSINQDLTTCVLIGTTE